MGCKHINGRTRGLIGMLLVLLMGQVMALAESPPAIDVGAFSAENPDKALPKHWEPLYFKGIDRHTVYRLVKADGRTVLEARADASASGLIRKISIDPKEYPIIRWQWKVTGLLKKGNVHEKSGDDYPARIYILFAYDPDKLGFFEKLKYETIKLFYGEYPPLASLNYIWASNAPKGLVVPNAYTDRAMMFVVESGTKELNKWADEERDIYADYRKAFKGDPPMISGVAIMTDTDNTGDTVTAYYGDITFLRNSH